MRRLLALTGVATMLGGGIALGTAASASAGTQDVSATCTGVTVNLQDFAPKKGGQANHVTVTLNGKVKVDRDFGTTFSNTYAFTNEYRMKGNDWSVSWTAYDDPSSSGSRSGTEAPCERPVQPSSYTETEQHPGVADCDAGTVTNETWTRTVTYVWDYDQWSPVPGEWQVTSETVPVTPGECAGDKPQPVVVKSDKADVDCSKSQRTVTTQTTTTDWVLNEAGTEWVKGTPVVSTSTATFPTTVQECPQVGDVSATIPPVVKGVKYEAAPALAYTGAESEHYGLAGLGLLVVGSALVLVSRKRRPVEG